MILDVEEQEVGEDGFEVEGVDWVEVEPDEFCEVPPGGAEVGVVGIERLLRFRRDELRLRLVVLVQFDFEASVLLRET